MTNILKYLQICLTDITLEPVIRSIHNKADEKIAIERIKLIRSLAFNGLKAIKEYEETEQAQLKLF